MTFLQAVLIVMMSIHMTDAFSGLTARCLFPPERGTCENESQRRESLRYYYDRGSKECVEFLSDGCPGGSLNDFISMLECERHCVYVLG
ncbi:hypothetical protein ScPMuIL_012582 [Solemya velum]